MKVLTTLIFTVVVVINCFGQDSESVDSLDKKLSAHFEKYQPELLRYSGLTFYGETKTNFSQDQISKELQLYNEIKNSNLINKPTRNVFSLCHNILIHSPSEGKEFLKLLNNPASADLSGLLITEFIFTGEFGE